MCSFTVTNLTQKRGVLLLYWFPFVLFAVYGLCIGSFLNVVIYRLPLKMPIAKGRSMCPSCTHSLSALDLVPLFSFLFLKGKCRYCGAPISWRYPGVEALTGLVFGLCGMVYGLGLYAVLLCIFFACLIVAWFVDVDHTYIPDRLHVIILGLAVCSFFIGPALTLSDRLGGLAIGFGMLLLSFATGGGIGLGDVKLLAVSGLLLGWKLTLPAFFLAYILAAVRWAPAYLRKKVPKDFAVPMAAYFAIALMLMSLFGERLLTFYFGLFR